MDDIKTPAKDTPPSRPSTPNQSIEQPMLASPKGGKSRRRKTRKGKKNPKTKRRS